MGTTTNYSWEYPDIAGDVNEWGAIQNALYQAIDTAVYAVRGGIGTLTASAPGGITQTWNASGVTFTGFKINITNTASASGSLLTDYQVGGVSKFRVSKNGNVTARSGSASSVNASFLNDAAVESHGDYGFDDDATITMPSGASAYGHASFNDSTAITGTENFDHHNSFQSYYEHSSSGTLSYASALFSLPNVSAGTVTNVRQMWASNPAGGGSITNNIAFYCEEMTRGSSKNYAIFVAGNTTKSHFGGGGISFGDAATEYATIKHDTGSSEDLIITPRSTYTAKVAGKFRATGAATLDSTLAVAGIYTGAARVEVAATTGVELRLNNTTVTTGKSWSVSGGGDGVFRIGQSGVSNLIELSTAGALTVNGSLTVTERINSPSYTVGTLPAVGVAGGNIYVSNESGGAVPAFSDGSNWRRVTDRAIVS